VSHERWEVCGAAGVFAFIAFQIETHTWSSSLLQHAYIPPSESGYLIEVCSGCSEWRLGQPLRKLLVLLHVRCRRLFDTVTVTVTMSAPC